jgi:hypothetical protein
MDCGFRIDPDVSGRIEKTIYPLIRNPQSEI